jgi:hypothetical protein
MLVGVLARLGRGCAGYKSHHISGADDSSAFPNSSAPPFTGRGPRRGLGSFSIPASLSALLLTLFLTLLVVLLALLLLLLSTLFALLFALLTLLLAFLFALLTLLLAFLPAHAILLRVVLAGYVWLLW